MMRPIHVEEEDVLMLLNSFTQRKARRTQLKFCPQTNSSVGYKIEQSFIQQISNDRKIKSISSAYIQG